MKTKSPRIVGWFLLFKRALNQHFEKLRKNLKKYVYQHDPIAILATHPVKKVLKEKNLCFPLRIQNSAILFQVDCAINQFVTSICESC